MISNDTIVAAATPGGESALAVVRVSGPLAGPLAVNFNGGREPAPWRLWRGNYSDAAGADLDEVLFAFFRGPRSYTGEDVLEVSSHGNPFIVSKLIEDLLRRGCRLAEPGEFTKRAFLSGRLDLTRAEAVMDVIRARSDRSLQAAQRQLRGNLGRWIQSLVERLLHTCAAVEAYIDFPDEDLPPEDRALRRTEIAELVADVERLRARRRSTDLLREGIRVVLLGEPNAGKSSVLNRLAGFDRAIVSDEPGTTRDFLEQFVTLGPHRLCLIDTAGLREAESGVERMGVQRTLECAEEADAILFVADSGRPAPTLPSTIASRMQSIPSLITLNKTDLPSRMFDGWGGIDLPVVEVSALTGRGFDVLRETLVQYADRLIDEGWQGEGVLVNVRHASALEEAAACLERAIHLLDDTASLELIGSELRGALDGLGRIVGRIDNEAVLDRLFAAFCIGK